MAIKTLGKVVMTPRGEYNPLFRYTALDIVSKDGSSYIVLRDTQGIEPPHDGNYALLAQKGDRGDSGYSPSISIGTVETVDSEENASVTNVGTDTNIILNFSLPRGRSFSNAPVFIDVDSYDIDDEGNLTNISFVEDAVTFATIRDCIFNEGREVYFRIDNGYLMRLSRHYASDMVDYLEFSYSEPDYIRYTITIDSDGDVEGTKTFLYK